MFLDQKWQQKLIQWRQYPVKKELGVEKSMLRLNSWMETGQYEVFALISK
jgi:hypothetical protein